MSHKLNTLFALSALLYLVALTFHVELLWLLKIIPIFLLAIGVFKYAKAANRSLLLVALFFSGCGDLLLAFDQFIFGVGAFLLAQLSYAAVFMGYRQDIATRWPLSLGLVVYMLAAAWLLFPELGELQIAVMVYLVAIAAMGLLATQSSLPLRWAALGALVFILSDSLIAVDKFLLDIPLNSYWVMISYYGAQWMLITGFLKAERT